MGFDRLKNLLYIVTYTYLVLPYLIFVAGWIRQPYSTFFIFILICVPFAGFKISKRFPFRDTETSPDISLKTIILILLPVLFVALFAGAGGWGFQDSDWLKHNSILRDLIMKPWPVTYGVENSRVMLTYYLAYQLPAAFVGKVLGWEAANHALFLYTLLGLLLCALWVRLLTAAKSCWFIVTFLLFSGMDVVGQMMSNLYHAPSIMDGANVFIDRVVAFNQMEWWAGYGFAQFSSNAALVVWVPNQSIAGWLLISLILNDAQTKNLHHTGLLYLGLCSLWSPFVTLGLIPFIAGLVFYEWRERHYSWDTFRQIVSWPNIIGLLIGTIVMFYLAGRFEPHTLPLHLNHLNQERITLSFLRRPDRFLIRYVLFVVLEFALLHALLYWHLMLQRGPLFKPLRNLLLLSSGVLFALPIFNWGQNNDLAMRTSIPALFITALVTIRALSDPPRGLQAKWVRRAILGVLIVGGVTAGIELGRHLKGVREQKALVSIPEVTSVETLFQLQERQFRKYNFVGQYVGRADSWFARYLAKE